MMIYCLENEFISQAVRYTMEFVLNSSGFFFKWMPKPVPDIRNTIHITYGDSSGIQADKPAIILPRIYPLETLHEQELEWNEMSIDGIKIPVLGLFQPPATPNTAINFDLIASIYFHLVRIEELKYKHPDEIDATVNQALLYKYNKYQTPVVDIIINWFGKNIENMLTNTKQPIIKKAAFPNGEQFGLALTHDIDITRVINPIKRSLLLFIHQLHLPGHTKYQEIQKSERKTWALDDLLDFYKRINWRATFNLISRLNEGSSFRYNINSRKFQKLFKRLNTEGHEIGFHPSRYAFNHPGRYKKELNKLKRISKVKIYGLRHHYLRCLFPQIWRVVQSLNLNYDSSLAYRRICGFRAGTTRAFSCFDHFNQSELNCLEFSTSFFEESLPNEGRDLPKTLDTISSLFKTVRRYQGVLTVLWHPSNMYQSDHFHEIWNRIVQIIEQENAFIGPLMEHLKWQDQRNQIRLTEMRQQGQEYRFNLSLHSNTEGFTLKIPGKIGQTRVENARSQFDKERGLLIIKPDSDKQTVSIQLNYLQ